MNSTVDDNSSCQSDIVPDDHHSMVQIVFGAMYATVFVASITGNTMVVYIVLKNKAMQTVTYLFICNLALSDLMVTLTSLWITPLYAFMSDWVWGPIVCYTFPLFQASSTFISTLTLLAIAVDRYIAILYPFNRSMTKVSCIIVIGLIWFCSVVFALPYVMHMVYLTRCDMNMCTERWPNDTARVLYGMCVLLLQFGIPFAVIGYCYVKIWQFLVNRKSSIIHKSSSASSFSSGINVTVKKPDYDTRKRRKLIKMLIAMVSLFALCWLPVNVMNILKDFLPHEYIELHFTYCFILAHFVSMSATCWNPILYAWMNDKFRNEFKFIIHKYLTFGKCLKRNLFRRHNGDECVVYTEEEFQQTTPTSANGAMFNNGNYFNFSNVQS